VSLGEGVPLERGCERGVPPKKFLSYRYQIVQGENGCSYAQLDMLLIITSSIDELFYEYQHR